MSNITRIADIKNNNTLITPVDTLRDAIEDIESGKKKCTKLLVLVLDDADDKYHTGFYVSNMKMSEMMALLSRWQHSFNKWMDSDA